MPSEVRSGASFELSTGGLGQAKGLSSLQDLFQSKVQLQLVADPDQKIDARMTVTGLPGVRYARMESGMRVSLLRERQMLSDQEDDVCLIMSRGAPLSIQQRGHETLALNGEAVLLDYREAATLSFRTMTYAAVRVPHAALAPLTRLIGDSAGRRIDGGSAALGLLRAYLGSLPDRIADQGLKGLIATHVYDLMALAIGATGDAGDLAAERGVMAARLQVVQTALRKNPELSIHEVAARQGVSPRYVQKLFEETGTTFTAFVLDLRLESARAMLTSPRYRHWKIATIAQEAGFGDLSYFNRCFRVRYDRTPSDFRAASI
jgi:AraC-like DNA-binding protein